MMHSLQIRVLPPYDPSEESEGSRDWGWLDNIFLAENGGVVMTRKKCWNYICTIFPIVLFFSISHLGGFPKLQMGFPEKYQPHQCPDEIFTPIPGKDSNPFWRFAYGSNGLVQPPTTWQFCVFVTFLGWWVKTWPFRKVFCDLQRSGIKRSLWITW